MLAKNFKTLKALCLWLEENKSLLEDEIGLKFSFMEVTNDAIIATVKDSSNFKIIIMPVFDFGMESLKAIENTLENKPEDGKYIGVVMLAESFPEELWEYIKTLKKYVRLVLALYLEADQNDKPAFNYPKIAN